jgi:hypothetical protein
MYGTQPARRPGSTDVFLRELALNSLLSKPGGALDSPSNLASLIFLCSWLALFRDQTNRAGSLELRPAPLAFWEEPRAIWKLVETNHGREPFRTFQ